MNPKFLFRRIKSFVKIKLGLNQIIFNRNNYNLAKAIFEKRELVDVMPGINLLMVIHPDMYFSIAYTEYVFEPDSLDFIRDHLEPGQIVLDVGANVGYFSLFFSKIVGSTGRVIAFEPGEFAFNLLKQNRQLNKFDWLEIYQAGLGETDAITTLSSGQPGMEVYNSLGDICHPGADPSKFNRVSIQLFEGASWLENHNVNQIDLMKLDVEGGEYTVLKGMLKLFQARKITRLLIEMTYEMSNSFGYQPSDIISMLRDCGYDWFVLKGYGRLVPLVGNEIPTDSFMFVAVAKNKL